MRDRFRRPLAALCLIALCAPAIFAQQPVGVQRKGTKKPAATPAAAEADPLAEVRRATAIQIVNALADEARNFGDPSLRARAQGRAADVLWETDGERARLLFRRAWEAAVAADEDNLRRDEEEKRRQMAERGHASYRPRPSIRTEVLRLAAKRDRALGEEFLKMLEEAGRKEAGALVEGTTPPPTPEQRPDAQSTPPAVEKRLRLAVQLLQDGDVERATQIAEPGLGVVSVLAIDFLSRLRPHDAAAADARFSSLLQRAQSDPAADANTVSLLSSYVFTPALFVTFTPDAGSNSSRYGEALPTPADLAPALRASFFNTASAILLRPILPAEQDQTSAGRAGTYMVITRLLPLFEQQAPAAVPALRTKLAALTPDTPERSRQPGNNALTSGLVPEDPNRDRTQETLGRLDRAKDSGERDAIYSDAALDAARRNDHQRAAEFVEKIEDLDARRQLRSYLDYEALDAAVRDKKGAQEVLRLARASDLAPMHRVWGLTEAARLLAKDEPGRAAEVLEEATAEARKLDHGTTGRVRALTAVVTQLHAVDRQRAWDMLAEIVKASNAAEGFTGEDATLEAELRTKFGTTRRTSTAESFDLAGLFASLAKENLDRAVELARSFKSEHPRTAATLAVARAVLDRKDTRAAR
ncbi:MAG TPA: hypothetical protein VF240_09020 [Pyrinomonadaceae bacterium]